MTEANHPANAAPAARGLQIATSRQFCAWLAEQELSLGLTTYQQSKLLLLGLAPNDRLSVFVSDYERCMGLYATPDRLYVSSLHQIWRLENFLRPGQLHEGCDRLFMPHTGVTTGDLDVHDLALDADGRLVFVNTLYGCLATLSSSHSFRPLWKPPFISKLAAEDRCHLNGLAMKDGHPAYVTLVGASDVADGWRDHRASGGQVIDVRTDEVVAGGLSMPHSPRWHNGKLWLLNAGTGFFGHVDIQTGRFEEVCFCPGFLRGLSFHGDFAVMGTSRPRHEGTFAGLALEENLKKRQVEPRCGLHVVDLRTGDCVHWLRMDGSFDELYDVATIPGVRRPMALAIKNSLIGRMISIDTDGWGG